MANSMCSLCSAGSRWPNTGVSGPRRGERPFGKYSKSESGAALRLHRFRFFRIILTPRFRLYLSCRPRLPFLLQRKKGRKERRQNSGFKILPGGGVWAPRPTDDMKAGKKITDRHASGRWFAMTGGAWVRYAAGHTGPAAYRRIFFVGQDLCALQGGDMRGPSGTPAPTVLQEILCKNGMGGVEPRPYGGVTMGWCRRADRGVRPYGGA